MPNKKQQRKVTSSKAKMSKRGWTPPARLLPQLEKLVEHNRKHPECKVGSIKIAQWLGRNGVQVSKDSVYRWLKKQDKPSRSRRTPKPKSHSNGALSTLAAVVLGASKY